MLVRNRKDNKRLIGGSSSMVGNSDGLCGRTMRADVLRTLSPAAAVAVAALLMGIASALSSVSAESETAAERSPPGRRVIPERSTSPAPSAADLPWQTAIAGQFLLLHFNQLIIN